MQQANDLLYGILQVVGRIEQNMKGTPGQPGKGAAPAEPKSKASELSNMGASIASFKNVNPKSIKTFFSFMDQMLMTAEKSKKSSKNLSDLSISMLNLGQALPGIGLGLTSISKVKAKVIETALFNLKKLFDFIGEQGKKKGNAKSISEAFINLAKALPGLDTGIASIARIKEKTMTAALKSLSSLFAFIEDKGKPSTAKKIQKGVDIMEKVGKALKGFNVIKDIGIGFMYLGAGILTFAGSIVLSAMILRLGKPGDIFIFLGVTIVGLLVMFGALWLAKKFIKDGVSVIKDMGLGMAALALGIISFALTIRLLPLIFKNESGGSIIKGMLIMVGIIGIMALAFIALDFAEPFVKGGFKTILLMSAGLAIFAITVLGLAMVAKMLSTGMTFDKNLAKDQKDENRKAMVGGLGIFALILIGSITAFIFLDQFSTQIKKGVFMMMLMGAGLIVFSIAVMGVAMVAKMLSSGMTFDKNAEKSEKDENKKSMLRGLGIFGLILLGATAAFALLGIPGFSTMIKNGVFAMMLMGAGLIVFSIAVMAVATVSKMLSSGMVFDKNAEKSEKDASKKDMIRGLGVFALILLGATAAFTILGIPGFSLMIKNGAVTMLLMGAALLVMSNSIEKLVDVSEKLKGKDIPGNLKMLIGGTIEGFIGGLSSLSGGKKGLAGILEFMKNSTKIFAGVAVLRAMSLALSMFAFALTAFAELENMRVIESYDKEGKPIFGEKINISKVADNITTSISTFLEALLKSTEGLTRRKAIAIKQMGRALTGKRGILSAVIQFADAMKIYAQFGEANEIGYVDYDDNGKEIHKKVSAITVVDNIISTFLYFTGELFKKSEEMFGTGEQDKSWKFKGQMRRMSKALIGKNGILGAVISFAEVMKIYAEFGTNNEIGYIDYDDKGKEIRKKVSADQVVGNIIGSFVYFANKLFSDSEAEFGDGKPEKEAGITGRQKRRMNRMTNALIGEGGVLGAVMQFANILKVFSEFEKSKIPLIDEKTGKPIPGKFLSIDDIATQIVASLVLFSNKLTAGLTNAKPENAQTAIQKFSGIITELSKFSESLSALEKTSDTISNLAKAINDLSVSLNGFDTAKLSKLTAINAATIAPEGTGNAVKTSENIAATTEKINIAAKGNEVSKDNWDNIAGIIGQHVGSSLVEAMKSGQIKFEFSPSGAGKGVLTFD